MANDGIIALTWNRVRLMKESPIGMIGVFLVVFWIVVAIIASFTAAAGWWAFRRPES